MASGVASFSAKPNRIGQWANQWGVRAMRVSSRGEAMLRAKPSSMWTWDSVGSWGRTENRIDQNAML